MRVLVLHGYLLGGTGSNVYTRELVAALVRLGHEVELVSQEPDPFGLPFVDAAGTASARGLELEVRRDPVRCAHWRPDIGRVLPVYVADRYAGFDARPFPELSDAEVEAYVDRNVAAVRAVVAERRPDVALAGHLVMAPVVAARALAARDGRPAVPYAVKIHGSALEYVVAPHPERFLPWAEEGLAPARAVLVGSRHVAERLWATVPDPGLPARTRLGPPGVDVELFRPLGAAAAAAALGELVGSLRRAAEEDPPAPAGSSFARDPAEAAAALVRLRPGEDRPVAYVGKLIVSKGVDLLLAAWPLVLCAEPAARLVVVGFGAYRAGLERLAALLASGDLAGVRALAAAGRAEEGGEAAPLRMLLAFLDALEAGDAGERAAYLEAAARLPDRVLWTGRLEHAELSGLVPLCEAQVVPSTFPEAFGMVAAEAAACGALPVCAEHSGLAEVARPLGEALGPDLGPLTAFPLGPDAVRELAARLVRWLGLDPDARDAARAVLAREARARYGWEGVAAGVVAAAEGRLAGLPEPL